MKVGNYVRTEISSLNLQRIGKIKKIISEDFIHTDIGTYDKENIIKSSPNIIDLIEVGDYVNGFKVDEIDGKGIYNYNSYDGWRANIASCNEEIKSTVTKEQFSQMEYRIGE